MQTANCPSCGSKVVVGVKPKMGQVVKCSSCASELEVIWLEPVELDYPYDVDEDDEELEDLYDED